MFNVLGLVIGPQPVLSPVIPGYLSHATDRTRQEASGWVLASLSLFFSSEYDHSTSLIDHLPS